MLANDIMKVIGVMVLSYVINMTVAGIVQIIGMAVGGGVGQIFSSTLDGGSYLDILEATTDALGNTLGISSILGAAAGMFALLILRGKKLFTTDITHVNGKCNIFALLKLFMLIMGISFLTSLIMYGADLILKGADGSASSALDEAVGGLLRTPAGILYVVLFGPIIEEIVFRGGIMRYLERYGANFAIVISSLAFGLYHIILFQAVFAFFCGLILAYTAGRFSLKWAVLLHILNNGISSVFSLTDMPEFLQWSIFGGCFLISVVVLIFDRARFRHQRQAGAPVAILDVLGSIAGTANAYKVYSYGQGAPSGAPYGQPQPPYGPAQAQAPYGAPAQAPYGQSASGDTPYGQSQTPYGSAQAHSPYGAPAQAPYGQSASGGTPYEQPQPPYGVAPAQTPYGPAQSPYGAPTQAYPVEKPHPYKIAFSNPLMIIILGVVFLLGLATVFLM
jgi:membrane protease YdiL (CAAX protease family)